MTERHAQLYHRRRCQYAVSLSLNLGSHPRHVWRIIKDHYTGCWLSNQTQERQTSAIFLAKVPISQTSIKMEPKNDTNTQIPYQGTIYPCMPCRECHAMEDHHGVRPLGRGEQPMAGRGRGWGRGTERLQLASGGGHEHQGAHYAEEAWPWYHSVVAMPGIPGCG